MGDVAQTNEAAEADVDDVPVPNSVPRRINAGKGIERLQIDFQGKACQSKQEHKCVTDSVSTAKLEEGNSADSYMKLACDVIFTQMTANKGFKQYGSKSVAAMIK